MQGVLWTQAQILTDLEIRLDDVDNDRWSEAQMKLAIQAAIRRAKGKWWEARLEGVQTYSTTDFRYDLPPACEGVEAIYFEPASSSLPRYFVVPSRWHVEGTELVFERRFPKFHGKVIYIHYVAYQNSLLEVTAGDGVIAGTAFSSVTGTFTADGVQEGDEVVIVGDDTYYVRAIVNATSFTLDRSGTTGNTLTYRVAYHTDIPYEYLINGAMAELYEMASRNRPGVEVEENIKWATYNRQLAAVELETKARHMQPQRRF